ncbi:hypothetical protein HaLaN_26306 [Haematococcus lacustris]|uniref:Uncharacterized protein n=1 Tax=Haematococcus lacustris TaxID=44745 RepID=A0A6A0A6A4_HAELA|nr:hypothetical protein HaLaN_26306 [Haematococcus lacustris]
MSHSSAPQQQRHQSQPHVSQARAGSSQHGGGAYPELQQPGWQARDSSQDQGQQRHRSEARSHSSSHRHTSSHGGHSLGSDNSLDSPALLLGCAAVPSAANDWVAASPAMVTGTAGTTTEMNKSMPGHINAGDSQIYLTSPPPGAQAQLLVRHVAAANSYLASAQKLPSFSYLGTAP